MNVQVYPAKGTQNRAILDWLIEGNFVTPALGYEKFGSLRLSERCRELEKMGWTLERAWIKTKNGARVMSYWLA